MMIGPFAPRAEFVLSIMASSVKGTHTERPSGHNGVLMAVLLYYKYAPRRC